MTDRPKVLYIAGWSRSGTTLLDRVLGQADNWFSCGELRTRYEDFTRHPQAVAEELRTLVGEPDAELPFLADTTVTLSRNHTVGGNPIRFSHGQLAMRPDEAWRANMDARSRALATIPALPLMPRYGYPVMGSRRDPGP